MPLTVVLKVLDLNKLARIDPTNIVFVAFEATLHAFANENQIVFGDADKVELSARDTMQKAVMKALPPKKAIRYLQLESKIRAMQDYDIAKGIPLVK